MYNKEKPWALVDRHYVVNDKEILGFFRGHAFLSNFHECKIEYEGLTFNSTEAAYQSSKTLDLKLRERFTTLSAALSKKEGRLLKLRPDWDRIKEDVMYNLCKIKFIEHEELRKQLLATGDKYLEETNWWKDTYWGAILESDGTRRGHNRLGHILMRIRGEIREKLSHSNLISGSL